MTVDKSQRNSSFELLRILAMFLILMGHFAAHGIQHVSSPDMAVNSAWLTGNLLNRLTLCAMIPGGRIGVMIFFMLTGFFLANKKLEEGIGPLTKVKPLVLQVLFYAGLFFFVGLIAYFGNAIHLWGGVFPESKAAVLGSLFPIGRGTWWFFTAYILLFLFSPVLNSLFEGLEKKTFIKLYIGFYIFFYFVPSFIPEPYFTFQRGLFGYLTGYYLRKYTGESEAREKITNTIIFSILAFILFYAGAFLMNFVQMKVKLGSFDFIPAKYLLKLCDGMNYAVFCPFAGVCLFILFKNLLAFTNKTINLIAGTTFGIYLIHDSPIRETFWKLAHVESVYNSTWFPVLALGLGIGLFLICAGIELGRQKIFSFTKEKKEQKKTGESK